MVVPQLATPAAWCDCVRLPQSSISLPFVYPGTLSGLRIAIATLLVLNEGSPCGGSGCALLPWCASARRLQHELYQHAALSVTLLAVHANRNDAPTEGPAAETCEHSLLSRATERLDPHDCPGLQLVRPTQRMMRLSRAHAARVIASGVMSYHPAKIRGMWPTLWKWELTRLHEYHAILYVDLDIELLPAPGVTAAIAAEWVSRLPRLKLQRRASKAFHGHYVGYGDITAPLNTGLFWLVPPEGPQLYEDGLAALAAPWNYSHGWYEAGTPGQLNRQLRLQHPVGTDSNGNGRDRLLRVEHKFIAGWDQIDYGDMDQGLFLYVLHYRHRIAYNLQGSRHSGWHFVINGPQKPWVLVLSGRETKPACDGRSFFKHAYLRMVGLPFASTPSACASAFRRVQSEVNAF